MYPYGVSIKKTKIQSMPVYTRGSHRIIFYGIYLVIVGRGKPRRYASANNEDEGDGNWNHTPYTCHRITSGGAWRFQPEGRALALVTDRFGSLLIIH